MSDTLLVCRQGASPLNVFQEFLREVIYREQLRVAKLNDKLKVYRTLLVPKRLDGVQSRSFPGGP